MVEEFHSLLNVDTGGGGGLRYKRSDFGAFFSDARRREKSFAAPLVYRSPVGKADAVPTLTLSSIPPLEHNSLDTLETPQMRHGTIES